MKKLFVFLLVLGLVCANLYLFYPTFTINLWDNTVRYFDLIFNPSYAEQLLTSANTDIGGEPVSDTQDDGEIVLVIDPGHGGQDPGAVSLDGDLIESSINLAIASGIAENLSQYDNITVHMTHRIDDNITDPPELAERAQLAGAVGADLLISIHNNANFSNYSGCEIYISGRLDSPSSQNAERLAKLMLDRLGELGMRRRGIFYRLSQAGWQDDNSTPNDYYGIIRMGEEMGIPSMLVENAFLNDIDSQFVSTQEAIERIADAHTRAILEYFGLTEHSATTDNMLAGDTNGNGTISIDDRMLAQSAVMCEPTAPVLEHFERADVNSSGLIDAFDLYAIREMSGNGGMLPSCSQTDERTHCIISSDTAAYSKGDQVTAWIQLGNWQDIAAAAGTVDYNTELFDFVGIESECEGLTLAEDSNFGLVRYCYLAPEQADGCVSFALCFEMTGTPDSDALSFNLNCYSSIYTLDGAIYSTLPNCAQTTMSASA